MARPHKVWIDLTNSPHVLFFRPIIRRLGEAGVLHPGADDNASGVATNMELAGALASGIAVGMATSIPPHNLAELCDAALYLVSHRNATAEQLLTFVQGPDFPTGGIIVDRREEIVETYRTGRGSFRVRARWVKEELPRGGWVAVVTEIPYGVQKSRLIEKLAELISERKLPLVADVRDESAEDVRIVFEPRARTIDPALMMETLFKLTELESRFSLNMNVLVDGVTPRVVSLDEALRRLQLNWRTERQQLRVQWGAELDEEKQQFAEERATFESGRDSERAVIQRDRELEAWMDEYRQLMGETSGA